MEYVRHSTPATPEELLALCASLRVSSHFLKRVEYRFRKSPADVRLITSAHDYFKVIFRRKTRLSGGSFMHGHLIPVAVLLMEYWQVHDAALIAAALGHDAIEDFRGCVSREMIAADLGSTEVAWLIDGMTKPPYDGRPKNSVEYSHAEIRKLESHGERVVFMKTQADRLHNMCTLWGTPKKKRWKIWETEQYYLPLAHRFGFPTEELRKAIAFQRRRLHVDDNQQ